LSDPLSPVPLSELCRWARQPQLAPAFSPLSADSFFLCDIEGSTSIADDERRAVRLWLRHQGVPTIAVGTDRGSLAGEFDVAVATMADVRAMLSNLRRSPIAASVFVQLLRATEGMDTGDALTVESLAYATLQAGPEFKNWLQSHRAAPVGRDERPGNEGPPLLVGRNEEGLDIELNRPSRRNAISVEVRDALVEAFALVEADETIRIARVSGRGRCFSIGGDLDEFGTAPDPATGHVVRNLALPARHLLRCLDRVEFRLHGACIGAGIELPAFAGRVTAAPDTFFQLPELRFGLIPGAGGCVSLPRRIGRQRTALLVLTGRRLGAMEALRWGLVDAVA
jgi:enoyl-CoA hydratase/carnithine racemase